MTDEELRQKIELLEQQIKDLKVKLEEKVEKKPYEVEVPEDIEGYYHVDETGEINPIGEVLNYYDFEQAYLRGLVFKTEEETEQFDKERILLFKLHKWAEEHNKGWKPNWNDFEKKQYYVVYDFEDKKFYIRYEYYSETFSKLPYFKSEEIAEQFIDEFGEKIKEVLY